MADPTSRLEENQVDQCTSEPTSPSHLTPKFRIKLMKTMFSELKIQRGIVLPLMAMNLTWFAKIAISTAFLGRLGALELAAGSLGFAFANVTGFSVLTGLCYAMEPICGQAYGAKNFKLLHKTLLMGTILLLLTTLPITFLWLKVDVVLIRVGGQQQDIANVAKRYVLYLLPDLFITSFLNPLKSYLSSQSITLPTMFSSALGLAFHLPVNILLVKLKGLEGIPMAIWVTDLLVLIFLTTYVLVMEIGKEGKWKEGGWWDQKVHDWTRLLKLCGPCCLNTCLEWWCYEILVLLTGRLPNATQAVGIITIVLNFDYMLFSVMLSLATCVSTRISNELGANKPARAYRSAYVSLVVSCVSGCVGALMMVGARGIWGPLFSNDKGIINGVKKMMLLMALIEVVNFPLAVCGGIMRGTAKPGLSMVANIGGFYFLALPLGVVFAFKTTLGVGGLLIGFLIGIVVCLALLLVIIMRIKWNAEAAKAQMYACCMQEELQDENHKNGARVDSQDENHKTGDKVDDNASTT